MVTEIGRWNLDMSLEHFRDKMEDNKGGYSNKIEMDSDKNPLKGIMSQVSNLLQQVMLLLEGVIRQQ